MQAGQEVIIVANTYMDGTQSNHVGKSGTIDRKAEHDKGYWVLFPGNRFGLYFEPEELKPI